MAQFCGSCGQQNPDNGLYCIRCGAGLMKTRMLDPDATDALKKAPPPGYSKNERTERNRKRRKARAILISLIASVLVLSAAAAGTLFFLSSRGERDCAQKLELIRNYKIPEYTRQTEAIEQNWSQTGALAFADRREILQELDALGDRAAQADQQLQTASTEAARRLEEADRLDIDGSAGEYRQCLAAWQQAIEQREYSQAKQAEADVERAYEETVRENDEYCSRRRAAIDSADLSEAPSEVRDAVSERMARLDELLDEQRYDEAVQLMGELEGDVAVYLEPAQELSISVQQIDVKSFPETKVYVSVIDESGNVPADLESGFFYIDKADANGQYVRQKVAQITQLNEVETLNIDMVVDVSGSMSGQPIIEVRTVMESFLRSVQFEAGDMVELTAFSSGVTILQEFCNDEDLLVQYARSLTTGDRTSLYDALYTAVTRVAARSDAKCVMAFTDGRDNNSSCTAAQVGELAKRLNVPIFIIGFGDVDTTALRSICSQTHGVYYDAAAISDMDEIYRQIYRQEKELYLISYNDTENAEPPREISLCIGYRSPAYGGECRGVYEPSVVIDVDDAQFYQSGPKAVVEKYVKGYAKAQTNSDFSYISPYLKPGSKIYTDMESFVKSTFSVYLDSFEIVSEEYADSNTCFVTVYETYYVQTKSRPLYLMRQKCKYRVEQSGGTWYLTDFAEPVEVLWEINQ